MYLFIYTYIHTYIHIYIILFEICQHPQHLPSHISELRIFLAQGAVSISQAASLENFQHRYTFYTVWLLDVLHCMLKLCITLSVYMYIYIHISYIYMCVCVYICVGIGTCTCILYFSILCEKPLQTQSGLPVLWSVTLRLLRRLCRARLPFPCTKNTVY